MAYDDVVEKLHKMNLARHELETKITDLIESNRALALLAYIGLYAIVAGLSIPGATLLTLAGGFLFGGLDAEHMVVDHQVVGAGFGCGIHPLCDGGAGGLDFSGGKLQPDLDHVFW